MSQSQPTYGGVEKVFEGPQTWVKGFLRGALVQTVLTPDRLILFKIRTGAGGGSETSVDHVTNTVVLDIPIASIRGASRHEKLMQKDRINIATTDGEYLFSGGWNDLGPAFRAQIERLGRSTAADGPDAWRVN